jgi:hypothetical protein
MVRKKRQGGSTAGYVDGKDKLELNRKEWQVSLVSKCEMCRPTYVRVEPTPPCMSVLVFASGKHSHRGRVARDRRLLHHN